MSSGGESEHEDSEDNAETFEVGQYVEIEEDDDKARKRQKGCGGWNPKMKASCGMRGFVYHVVESSGQIKVALGNRGYRYGWSPENAKIVDSGSVATTEIDKIVEDARVRVRPEIDEPSKGWGGVKKGEVGVVTSITDDRATVSFGDHAESWACFRVELEPEDAEHAGNDLAPAGVAVHLTPPHTRRFLQPIPSCAVCLFMSL